MLRKTYIKILSIIVLTVITILLLCNIALAATPGINPDDFIPSLEDSETLNTKAGAILGVVSVIGTISSVAVIMVVGIKYMLGSLEEKAEYKKTMITYLIGAVLLFSATMMPTIIYNVSINLGKDTPASGKPIKPGVPNPEDLIM